MKTPKLPVVNCLNLHIPRFCASGAALASVVLCFTAASPVHSADRSWTNASGGDFGTGTNWSDNSVPGSSDKAIFSLDETYTVTLSGGVTNEALDSTAGTVAIDLGLQTYALTGVLSSIHSSTLSPSLSITGGTFTADQIQGYGANNTGAPASLTFTGAGTSASVATQVEMNSLNTSGFVRLNVLDGATFSMPNLGSGTNIFKMTWKSEFNVSGQNSSAAINGWLDMDWSNSVIRVQDGGHLSTTLIRMAQRNLPDHTVFVDGAGSLFETGDIRFVDGSGTTSKGTVLVTGGGRIESNSAGRANRDGADVNLVASGTDSEWNGTNFYVGGRGHLVADRRGSGQLLVADGAEVSASRVTVQAAGILTGDGLVATSLSEGVRVLGGTVNPGVYAYSHTFGADSSNTTTFSLGASLGTLNVNGNFALIVAVDGEDTFTPNLNIRVAEAGSSDQLNVLGDLTLAGILNIDGFGDPVLAVNDTFQILNWSGTLSGEFDVINALELDPGMEWDFDNLYLDGTISIIPESSTYAAIFGCLTLAVVLWRRRRGLARR